MTGFFDDFYKRASNAIALRVGPWFTFRELRREMKIPNTDRSSISFLAKTLSKKVLDGSLAYQNGKYKKIRV